MSAKHKIASRKQREGNIIFDNLIIIMIILLLMRITNIPLETGKIDIFSYPISFFYYLFFEFFFAKTPGKFLTGTKVVRTDNRPLDLKTIALRSLIRLVPFEWISFLGSFPIGLHDSFSSTIVIDETTAEEPEWFRKVEKVLKIILYIILGLIIFIILVPIILVIKMTLTGSL